MGKALAVNEIVAGILEDVAAREARIPFREIKAMSRDTAPTRNAIEALMRPGCSVIVEIKRRLPHSGTEFAIDSIADAAAGFQEVGAHLIACQTEHRRFLGSLEDMCQAREAVEVPMMMRDIIVDPYQVHEARVYGSDVVPLQVELLEQARFEALVDRTESLGMTAVAEVRTPEEADRALRAGVRVVGVNAWSITSDELNRENFAAIVPGLPAEIIRIAVGGVRVPKDLLGYAGHGADAVLIGESILSAENPRQAAQRLVATGQHPACPSR
ncbi:indole-3-glycerol phosphate synthase TrpC [Corynebacterium guangdongense]|uniref:indole-3-glycerol phosphate synthase TrpC n=1 Tax=Corynebacterium guangdongense TaxID=1783348 RepID=UPI0025B3972F|nr:indole-3-glycerol-phosphate synthase TrpC [Corynebacterium guangdongense]WJZ18237.1 Indole-3-glycerol phosphate synthase [Corynebacterium guangdongense]